MARKGCQGVLQEGWASNSASCKASQVLQEIPWPISAEEKVELLFKNLDGRFQALCTNFGFWIRLRGAAELLRRLRFGGGVGAGN
eukprot:symbB.v1.2.014390.t1/scaffold1052.1/size141681/7